MKQRLNLAEAAPDVYRALSQVEGMLRESGLDPLLRHLVKLRASQINGCLFCVDMHAHEALNDGETPDRIFQLPAWRESELFTEAERAALAYTESATRLGEDGVPDEVWDRMAAHFSQREQAALVAVVAMINLWNRIAVPTRARPPARPVPEARAS
ncbi:alkyl hydroperoxide reductase AhpD [Actinomadura rubrobrunea]|uniref:Alkyl hydroperoxide reductase AhpD n=1 Tax=Actinomadura rubrobrunea TaxID=115335 RepID=A0A9W6UV38_9ACTN|nr:carboxymuconolactone decarboxylase family protein [Actinomadura rubrobrunea]GLW62867.1 alkyl hydroperoxide reductase AhpD [Actinomadura rubrobrunea]